MEQNKELIPSTQESDDKNITEAELLFISETKKNPSFVKLCYKLFGPSQIQIFSKNILSTNNTLKYLDLMGNRIGDEGAIAIAEALKINTTLEYLNLSCNEIGPEGGESIAKVLTPPEDDENIPYNKTLQHLDLSMNRLGNEGVSHFAKMLRTNKSLITISLRSNKVNSDKGVSAIMEILAIASSGETLKDAFV